jgi:hypothetical protein
VRIRRAYLDKAFCGREVFRVLRALYCPTRSETKRPRN